ncbi:hypothetical protein HNR44_001166 [Geomicrobium halophilum]|uniref:DUF2642 domain-containing protein n=1 Tax=Geomicrobium halophilum TaxID=549000 RepID=A0A841PK27_9BACL|nr:hypothetical protein [Geomicrobium halophilum]MBB6449217.1 hypothetical protein [Geomicrobium halophilum]
MEKHDRSQLSETPINDIRQAVVTEAFANAEGERALILIPQFPFLIIGDIIEVDSDYVVIDVETAHIAELEERSIRIHIDDIEVFVIEDDDTEIPSIR